MRTVRASFKAWTVVSETSSQTGYVEDVATDLNLYNTTSRTCRFGIECALCAQHVFICDFLGNHA